MAKVNFKKVNHKQDYISADGTTAISSNGLILSLGDKVKHEGDEEGKEGTIEKFYVNTIKSDVIAVTEHGVASISFYINNVE